MITINTQLQQQIALGLSALLTLFICVMLVYTAQQWRSDWQLAHQAIAAPALMSRDATASMITSIPNDHLFGKSFSKSGNVPITNLQLRVTGIVKAYAKQGTPASKAYISIAGQPSKIYQVGDNLPYGVKVYDIAPDAVMLENDGHLEKLPMPRERLEFKPRFQEERL